MKAPAPQALDAGPPAIDEAIGDEVGTHAELEGHHILIHVVADHQALLGLPADLFEQVLVVGEVGFGIAAPLIGRDGLEVSGLKTRPAYALMGSLPREERGGGQDQLIALVIQVFDHLDGAFASRRRTLQLIEFPTIEGSEAGIERLTVDATGCRERAIETLFVGRRALALKDHRLHPGEHAFNGRLHLVAKGRTVLAKEVEIAVYERVMVEGQKRSVQIEEDGGDGTEIHPLMVG